MLPGQIRESLWWCPEQSQHRSLFTKKKKKLCWMAMRKSDRVTFCMHYCRYSHVKMNENCGLYPLHCLTGRPEWRDAQLVRNASFKGWAVRGSFYALSIVCHAHIACSKNISHSFSSFISDHCSPPPSSSAGVIRGQSQLICVYVVRGGASLAAHYRSRTWEKSIITPPYVGKTRLYWFP